MINQDYSPNSFTKKRKSLKKIKIIDVYPRNKIFFMIFLISHSKMDKIPYNYQQKITFIKYYQILL